ncbi:MAG: mannose-6-phosphate isomerase [Syntrophus sp. (in: bacteria)]|nr:mannose-6-phosphate isomerase [Syntrophus sp. (in: bacteria)]
MCIKTEDHRPWGYYQVLCDETSYKVKRIIVYPGKRLSLQRHLHRNEHWYILAGEALVRCSDREVHLKKGDSIDIPEKTIHRVFNTGFDELMFIEVQRGDYCGEDDIERIEDDYGRV